MDPLSDVLSLLKPKSSISAGLEAGRAWSIRFPPPEGIKFNAVMRGSCWLSVGGSEPLRLEQGDCFLLTRALPFLLASDLDLTPMDSGPIYKAAGDCMAMVNGRGEFFLIGGRFSFAGRHAALLFESLPPVLHVREASSQASVLRWALDHLAAELAERRPGGALVSEHLAHIMLVQVLRLYLTAQPGSGWLHAFVDRQIGPVVAAIHANPARRWTLNELAALAGMSRSTFTLRFRQVVGTTPMEYLTRWRMLLAGERLRSTPDKVAAIAAALGYESESAFSTAFKRVMATSPRQYQREM